MPLQSLVDMSSHYVLRRGIQSLLTNKVQYFEVMKTAPDALDSARCQTRRHGEVHFSHSHVIMNPAATPYRQSAAKSATLLDSLCGTNQTDSTSFITYEIKRRFVVISGIWLET